MNLNKYVNTPLRAAVLATIFVAAFTRAADTDTLQLKRGQYLVESAGACADCHTARDWKGTLDHDHWLQGTKLDFKPSHLMPWADRAPSIAGLTNFASKAEAITFFETGIHNGKKCAPPMPQYRFNHDDAVAIVSYLRSLPSTSK